MLEHTLERLEGVLPASNILVLTNYQQYEKAYARCSKHFPRENILAEPEKRDTAPADALGIGFRVAARDPQGHHEMVLPSDHLIRDQVEFQRSLKTRLRGSRTKPTPW